MTKIKETVLGIIAFIVIVGIVGRVGYWEIHYDRQAVVTDVVACENEYLVGVEDNCGYTWEFYAENEEDFKVGQDVVMRMMTNDTDSNIFDDEIENVKLAK